MINEVLYGITEAVKEEFPNSKIYADDKIQKLEEELDAGHEVFLMTVLEPSREKQNCGKYKYDELVVIQYFSPKKKGKKEDINSVIERLQNCTELIEVEYEEGLTKKVWTNQADVAIVEDILTFTIRISDIYHEIIDGDKMEDAEIGVRHGQ